VESATEKKKNVRKKGTAFPVYSGALLVWKW